MPWDASSFHRHNHSLTPEQAAHASRIANAILRRSGNEGESIATANKLVRRDYGGSIDPSTATYAETGTAPTAQTMSPMMQGMIQRYSSMSPEQLQQLSVMMGGSPQGQVIQRILQQKRVQPQQQARGGDVEELPGITSGPPRKPWGLDRSQASNYLRPPPPIDPNADPRMLTDNGIPSDSLMYQRHGKRIMVPARPAFNPLPSIDPSVPPPYATPAASEFTLASGGIIARRDSGGIMSMSEAVPSWTRQEERGANTGFLHGATAGRADSILGTAPAGSYVLPADVVSGLGEGNSLAGARAVEEMLSTGPHGIPLPRGRAGRGPPSAPAPFHESNGGFVPAARTWKGPTKLYRAGGVAGPGNEAVALSDGEFVVPPEHVAKFGGGDHGKGIKALDDFVLKQRAKHIAKLKSLPPPVGAKK